MTSNWDFVNRLGGTFWRWMWSTSDDSQEVSAWVAVKQVWLQASAQKKEEQDVQAFCRALPGRGRKTRVSWWGCPRPSPLGNMRTLRLGVLYRAIVLTNLQLCCFTLACCGGRYFLQTIGSCVVLSDIIRWNLCSLGKKQTSVRRETHSTAFCVDGLHHDVCRVYAKIALHPAENWLETTTLPIDHRLGSLPATSVAKYLSSTQPLEEGDEVNN